MRIEQGAFKGRENQMTRSEQGRKECNADEPAAIRAFSEYASGGQDPHVSCPPWSIRALGRADRPALLIASNRLMRSERQRPWGR